MAATDVIKAALERNCGMVDRALEGLDEATLARQVTDQCNSIAWLMWHMNRVVDIFVNTRLRSKNQIWLQDGWHQRFGMNDDPGNQGGSWTAGQVAAWVPPPRDALLGYYEATKASAREYLSSLTDADLDAGVAVPPANEPRPVHDLLGFWYLTTWSMAARSPSCGDITRGWGGSYNVPLHPQRDLGGP